MVARRSPDLSGEQSLGQIQAIVLEAEEAQAIKIDHCLRNEELVGAKNWVNKAHWR